ncbi:MAG: DUF4391 domain-containing protein [Candidatus Obscuribacter phosphatis]|uniref:DUF4391 domain-containing protein n=1 Tax=Candidatus Obscuribacter phosphatis TaxID=1906157 RepID=A0A8J7TJW0_9BACT|nr:DUF4391 domain-containing protein [Candidatus Obscuribacter phosphatis]
MKTLPFEYPENAAVGKVVHKNKFYKQTRLTPATKELFVRQVEIIVWEFKLAPETVNIKRTSAVPEIQIFSISLKTGELKSDVLRCIDMAIPFPIIFELRFNDELQSVAAYKRPSEANSTKLVISEYFFGDWVSVDSPRRPLPMVFNLDMLYGHLLAPLMPYQPKSGERLEEHVQRMESIRQKQTEVERCRQRLQREKQFNRKVSINAELRELEHELENLTITPLASE